MRFLLRNTATLGLIATMSLFSASASATNHNVSVGSAGNSFSPNTLAITAGDTVTFTYGGGQAPHNVVSDPGAVTAFRCAAGCDGAGGNGNPSAVGWTSVITFPEAGTIAYYCEIHGGPGGVGMSGTITVTVPVELQTFDVE